MIDFIANIPNILVSAQKSVDLISSIKNLIGTTDNIELQNQLADLANLLIDQKTNVAEMKEQLLQKNNEITSLKKEIDCLLKKDEPEFKFNAYVFKNDTGRYCTRCYDADYKKIRVIRTEKACIYRCQNCKNEHHSMLS